LCQRKALDAQVVVIGSQIIVVEELIVEGKALDQLIVKEEGRKENLLQDFAQQEAKLVFRV